MRSDEEAPETDDRESEEDDDGEDADENDDDDDEEEPLVMSLIVHSSSTSTSKPPQATVRSSSSSNSSSRTTNAEESATSSDEGDQSPDDSGEWFKRNYDDMDVSEEDKEYTSSEEEGGAEKTMQALYDQLKLYQSVGSFYCGGQMPSTMPGLFIEGYGKVHALGEEQVRQIAHVLKTHPSSVVSLARKEGGGAVSNCESTVEIKLLNKEYEEYIYTSLLKTIINKLCLVEEASGVSVKLRGLTLQGSDIFCNNVMKDANRKESEIFGSLIVILPSNHSDEGNPVVRYRGKSEELDMNNKEYTSYFMAFFSECRQFSPPVTRGFRLSLTFDLTYKGPRALPTYESISPVKKAKVHLDEWTQKDDRRKKSVFMLQQRFNRKEEFLWSSLEGNDKVMAQILEEAARGEYLVLAVVVERIPFSCSPVIAADFLVRYARTPSDVKVKIDYLPVSKDDIYFDNKKQKRLRLRYGIMIWNHKDVGKIMEPDSDRYVTSVGYIKYIGSSNVAVDSVEWKSFVDSLPAIMEPDLEKELGLRDMAKMCIKMQDQKKLKLLLSKLNRKNDPIDSKTIAVLLLIARLYGWSFMMPAFLKYAFGADGNELHELWNSLDWKPENQGQTFTDTGFAKVLSRALREISEPAQLIADVLSMESSKMEEALEEIKGFGLDHFYFFLPLIFKLNEAFPSFDGLDQAFQTFMRNLASNCVTQLKERLTAISPAVDGTCWSFTTEPSCHCRKYCRPVADFLKDPLLNAYPIKNFSRPKLAHIKKRILKTVPNLSESATNITKTRPDPGGKELVKQFMVDIQDNIKSLQDIIDRIPAGDQATGARPNKKQKI